jgi:hypothetical protein
MTMSVLRCVIAVSVGVVLFAPAMAHHGWGGYKEDVEISVTITALKLGNPHDRLTATSEDGQEWNLLLAPPARNRRFGFNEESVSVGDVVDLVGQKHPSRAEIKVHCINMNGENLYTYRYDNGRTSLSRQRKGDDC